MNLPRAALALEQWPVQPRHLSFVAHRENEIYRVDTKAGSFALRQHRKGYRTDQELQSELQFMEALANRGLTVPQPAATHAGSMLAHVDGQQFSLLTWLPGTPLGTTGVLLAIANRMATFRQLGVLAAQLHTIADNWSPPHGFVRQSWDADGLLGEHPQWGRFWDNPMLDTEQKSTLWAVRQKLQTELVGRAFDMGLIHADLVSENLLLHQGAINLIDFDDAGWGYRLQDLATALVKHEAEPDFAELRQALFEGYQTLRPLDRQGVATFLLIRHLSYVGWIVPRMQTPEGERKCKTFITNVMPRARAYLAKE